MTLIFSVPHRPPYILIPKLQKSNQKHPFHFIYFYLQNLQGHFKSYNRDKHLLFYFLFDLFVFISSSRSLNCFSMWLDHHYCYYYFSAFEWIKGAVWASAGVFRLLVFLLPLWDFAWWLKSASASGRCSCYVRGAGGGGDGVLSLFGCSVGLRGPRVRPDLRAQSC